MEKGDLDFKDRVALVTGSSRGIGRQIAREFAASGAEVAVHYQRDRQAAESVVREIQAAGGHAFAFQADLAVEAEVARLSQQVIAQFGRLDILVNNAGQYDLMASIVQMSAADWDQILQANLRSVFLSTRSAARRMIAQGQGGTIINIASIEAHSPMPEHSHYDASKAGVVMLTRASALELGEHSIRVNAISPGLIWREGIEQDWPEGVERWRSTAALKKLGRPQDIANACLFLASPAAAWITGINLVVDGGASVRAAF